MKKNYQKPELFYEDFRLMDSIAACAYKVGFTEYDCTWYSEELGTVVFTNPSQGCLVTPQDFVDNGMGCLHIPSGEVVLFGS